MSWLGKLVSRVVGPELPQPEPCHHPSLGTLVYQDEGWWSGRWSTELGEIEITVTGTPAGPDSVEAAALAEKLERYTVLRAHTLGYLNEELRDPRIDATRFNVTAIDHLWSHGGGHYFVDLEHPENPYAIWRVEFVDDQPAHIICDR